MTSKAAVYARISSDPSGRGLGVERQRKDCLALAKRLGWTVVETYVDNDVSASSGRPRPAYERMLLDVEAGRIDAIVVYDVDRLTRRPVELEAIIALAESLGVSLASVGGEIDLATPQGRLTARIKGSVGRHEVEQQSRRIRRKSDERAAAGLSHGFTPYGWKRLVELDDDGRTVVTEDVDEPAAEVVREIDRRLLAGESLRAIAADFNQRAVPMPRGPRDTDESVRSRGWGQINLRQLALRDSNAGHRTHRGVRVGPSSRSGFIEPAVHDRVVALLTDPARRTGRPGGRRYLLSGIAKCGKCGEPMRPNIGAKRPPAYICPGCLGLRRLVAGVDDLVTKVVVARLALPDAADLFTDPDAHDAGGAADAAAGVRAKLDIAADQFAADVIDHLQLARITARLRPELERLEADARSRSAHPDLLDLADPNIADRWEALPIDRKRAVIDALISVTILPVGKTGRPDFQPSGVRIDWRRSLDQ